MNISVAKQRIDAHNSVFSAKSRKIEPEVIFLSWQNLKWQKLPLENLNFFCNSLWELFCLLRRGHVSYFSCHCHSLSLSPSAFEMFVL